MIAVLPVKAGLSFGLLPDDAAIPIIVAQDEGLFAKQGVDVELVHFKTAIERDSALQTGRIDGTVADIVATAFAVDNQKGIKITSMADSKFDLLAANASAGYQDLKDEKIAISSNTVIDYLTDKFFAAQGIDPAKLNTVAIPKIPVRLQLLLAGKIKAATLPEPLASLAAKQGAHVVASSAELGGAPTVIMFSKKSITNKTADIKAFYAAYSQAVKLVNKDPEQYRQLIVDKGGFPASIKDKFEFITYHQPYLPEQKMINDVLDWMNKGNLLKNKVTYNDLVSGQFVK